MKSFFKIITLVMFLLIFGCKESSTLPPIDFYYPEEDTLTAKVAFVYDGDTFSAIIKNKSYKVRVTNIDTYESSKTSGSILERLTKQADLAHISIDSALKLGIKAKKLADSLLSGNYVRLERRGYKYNTDVYERLLRYVVINGMKYDSLIISAGLNTKL